MWSQAQDIQAVFALRHLQALPSLGRWTRGTRRDWQSSKDNHQIFVVLELRLSLTGSAQWQRFNETLELKCRPLPRLRHARNMISCVPALRYVCSERAQRSLSLWTFVLLTVARPVPCSKSCPHSVAATLGTCRRA